jgi:2-amino-4-hydroxy-6-hydroxymethyldihydropteridine diphosphokinase
MTRTFSRASTPVLIGLGSNVGDRLESLRRARRTIAALAGTRIVAASAVFETDPVGGPPQGAYLNACVAAETTLGPTELLDALLAIEADAGRVRTVRDAPRTLDLDVLLFGDREISLRDLAVPHPRLSGRAFALVPAAEIAAAWKVPPSMETLGAVAARAGVAGVRRFCAPEEWS